MAKLLLCPDCTGQWCSSRCSLCPIMDDEFNDYPCENRHHRSLQHDKNPVKTKNHFSTHALRG